MCSRRLKMLVRLHRLLQRPVVVVAVEDAGLRLHVGALERRRQQLHLVAELGDLLEDAAVALRVVRQDRAVELLGAEARLAPAEEDDRRRPAGHQLVGEHPQHPGPHQRVDLLPGHIAGLLLHHPEARVAVRRADVRLLERAQHVDFAGQLGGFGFQGGGAFDGDEINGLGQVEVIEAMDAAGAGWS